MNNGAPQITINGTNYSLSQINSVTPAAPATTSNAASGTTAASNTQTTQ
jgi:hypothetical protein